MKKINVIVRGINESIKAQFKEKRILKSLEVARINAEEELVTAEAELNGFDATGFEADEIVTRISQLLEAVEDAKYNLEHISKIEDYFNQEVED